MVRKLNHLILPHISIIKVTTFVKKTLRLGNLQVRQFYWICPQQHVRDLAEELQQLGDLLPEVATTEDLGRATSQPIRDVSSESGGGRTDRAATVRGQQLQPGPDVGRGDVAGDQVQLDAAVDVHR